MFIVETIVKYHRKCRLKSRIEGNKKLDAEVSQEVMGVVQSPNGSMKSQHNKMKKIIIEWQSLLENGYLSRKYTYLIPSP